MDGAICQYLEDQWMELEDSAPSDSKGVRRSIPLDQASTAASYVHLLASKYGWGEQYILNMPISRILQYRNLIISEIDPQHKPASLAMNVIREYNERFSRMLKESK
ncbi:hypothetical protein [Puniceicoccus vermicola]|uniref:Uncharacterized protein n=1 Tax=Puniceicoccus vermicola TaxID=388746 RepID=A0A7X1AY74_9BACT|nr:hypothetical protein [Puniceicoccus vermicola]MBC2602084.1 hypothetical protein [Puniceicoccus vermicola]